MPHVAKNEAPSVGEILDFMRKYSKYTALGYSVDTTRDDYRQWFCACENEQTEIGDLARAMIEELEIVAEGKSCGL